MKLIKKSVALFLAILMISSSFAMLATAADAKHNWSSNTVFYRMQRNADGYIVDADGNVIADENDELTGEGDPVWVPIKDGRIAKGETVKARIFLQTDFALTSSDFFFVYPTAFLTHDTSGYKKSGSNFALSVNDDPDTLVASNEFSGVLSTKAEIGTSGKAYLMKRNGVITDADMTGLGWIFVQLNDALDTMLMDGTEWLMEFNFTVNSSVSDGDVGQVYLHPKCIADKTNRKAATIIGADPEGEMLGYGFLGGDESYGATDVADGTFAYTEASQDEDSTLTTTTTKLTFNANGGKFADGTSEKTETADIQPMVAATLPDDPKIAGGEFLGWVNADIDEPTEADILEASDIKYGYYDVAYKAYYLLENSATIVINYTDAKTGELVTVNQTVGSKTGYTVKLVETVPAIEDQEPNTTYVAFADLTAVKHYKFDEANSTEREIEVAEDGSSVMNVYYMPEEYTVTFNPDNGDAETTETKAYWTEIEAPAAPAKSGMKFTGWKLEGTDTVIAAGAKFNIEDNVTYKAQYESAETTVAIKVKYNDLANGGAEVIVPHDTVDTIVGYTVALSETAEGTDDVNKTTSYKIANLPTIKHYEYDATNTTTVTATEGGTAELIVAYKPVKYTATFEGAETFADVDYFTEIIAPKGTAPAGQTFTGWKLEGSDPEVVIAAGDKFNIADNVNYTPVYDFIYYNTTLSFEGEAGVDYPEEAVLPTVNSGKMGDPINLVDPDSVEGWTFNGWVVEGAVEENDKYYYGTSNVTATGSWTLNEYTITYWLDADKNYWYDTHTYFYGDLIEVPYDIPADLLPPGQEFVDWETDIPLTMPAENLEIFADTNLIEYEVKITTSAGVEDTLIYFYGEEINQELIDDYSEEEGWSYVDFTINGKKVDLPYTVTGKIGIKINQTRNKYPVYFWMSEDDYNAFEAGDTTVEYYYHEAEVEFEAPINAPVNPSKDGHIFLGWDMDPTNMEAHDMHFYADWDVESYTVYWDINGEVRPGGEYAYGEDLDIPEVTKPGYEFGGWAGLAEGTTTMPDVGENGGSITYYAILNPITFDAKFYLDDEKKELHATVPTAFDAKIEVPAVPTKDGYDFGGWAPAVDTMNVVGGMEFVAIWNPQGDTPYTVSIYTMDTEGNYGAAEVLPFTAETDSPVSYAPEAKTGFTVTEDSVLNGTVSADGKTNLVVKYSRNQYTFKTVVDGAETSSTTYYYDAVVAAPETPVKEGNTFSGWDAAVPAKMPANDVTLSGTFSKAQFDLIYMVDGEVYTSKKVTFGDEVTVIDPLTKEGYNFSGWDKTGTFTMPAETVTISGTFAINSYKVIYKVDGNVVHEATAEYNSKVDLYDYTPEVGYNFSGWDKVDGFTMPAEDVTVNGTTSLITKTVTYEFRGDVPADYPVPAPVTATYGENLSKYNIYGGSDLVTGYVSTCFGVRGAVFVEATGEYYVGTEDITIIYVWNRVSVRITTNYTGDVPAGYESTEDWSKSYNDTFTLTTPTEEGYTFKGWTVEGAAEYDAATGTVKVGTAAITITGAWEINKHDVIYMVDGEVYKTEEDVAYGTTVTVIDDLVEAGKEFSGWDKTGTFTMPDEDVIINGSWTTNNYTVTYYTDKDKTATHFTYTGAYGAEYNIPLDPEKEGHKFLGWANVADDSAAGLPEAGTITNVPLNGAEYYATWKTLSYKLVYAAGTDAQFSDGATQKTYDIAYGTAQAEWPVPAEELSRPGYTFGGWDMSKAPATMGTTPVRIAAIWNPVDYTVTWIDGDSVVTEHYIYGEEILAPEVEKEGFTFNGWLEADGETIFSEGDIMGEKSLVYTAQWEGNDGIEYTVYKYFEKLDKSGWEDAKTEVFTGKAGKLAEVDAAAVAVEGFYIDSENSIFSAEIEGDGSTALAIYYRRNIVNVTVKDPEGKTYIDDEFTFGEEITLEDPKKEGFTFVEWQDADGNTITFPMTAPADDIVIKPIWSANKYTITFVDDNGNVIEAAKSVEYGSKIVAPADPEKDGYKFAYWRDKDTKAVMPVTMPAKDVVYEAFYTAGEDTTYYIEVYMMDTNGDYTMASQTVATGTTGDPISITPGNVEGCTYDADRSVLTGIITADGKATLKVYYARKLFNVTFKAGYGDNAVIAGPTEVYFGAAIPTPAQPTREGYDFVAWDTEVPATMPAEDLTFTATWTEAEYTITYIVNDKKTVETYKFGEAVATPKNPEVAGMNFTGWDTEIPATMPAEDLIIIAVFEISVYEVKYMVDGVVFQQYAVAHGDEIPVPTEEPTKKFYNFVRWTEIPATMPAQDIEINAIFERVDVKLIPMEGSTTVIDDETMAIYGLELYATEEILRESYLDVEGDGYFTVTPSKKTACGTGTVIELYDRETGVLKETYTIVIFGDLNGDSKINSSDHTIAKAEADGITFWSDPMFEESYDAYKTMAADFDGDTMISVKEAASIERYIHGVVDIVQKDGNVISLY